MKMKLCLSVSALLLGLSTAGFAFNSNAVTVNAATGDAHSVYFKGASLGVGNYAHSAAGWWNNTGSVAAVFENETVEIGGTSFFNAVKLTKDATYLASYDLKTDGSSTFYFVQNTGWNVIQSGTLNNTDYVHYEFTFTSTETSDSSIFCWQVASGSISVQNLYISETTSISVTEGSAIGTLPDIPDVEGKVGHYEIDGTPIDATTVYNYSTDKYASLVYENDGKHNLYFALGQGNYASSNAGWWVGASPLDPSLFVDGAVSLSGTAYFGSAISLVKDKTYVVSYDLKTNGSVAVTFQTNGTWQAIQNGSVDNADYVHYEKTFVSNSDSSNGFVWTIGGDATVSVKNLYVAENSPLSVEEGEAIGTLPDMPSITDKVGHYEIDGTKIGADTVYNYTTDKFATSVYVDASYAWGKSFLSTTDGPCSNGGTESNYDKLSAVWGDLKTSYAALSDSEKAKVTGADVTGDGSLSRALARYDWIVNRYDELDDFMSRRNEGVSAVKGLLGQSNKTDGAAIAAASALSLAAVGTSIFLFAKKKKRD